MVHPFIGEAIVTRRATRTLEPLAYVAIILGLLVLLQHIRHRSPLADYDFTTGLVKCAVGGLTVSCGSVARE